MATAEEIGDLWAVHKGPIRADALRQSAAAMDDTRKWVDPNGYRLSDRLWNQRADVRRNIDLIVREMIAEGADALQAAKRVERYLNPAYAPHRTVDGRILRDGRKGVLTDRPRSGTGSYPARRLMRTETTRAVGQAQFAVAQQFPSVVWWRLSPSHPEIDICDEYADRDEGWGRGRYRPGTAPRYPAHPHCLCSIRVVPIESDRDLVNRLRSEFDLGDPLSDLEFDRLGVLGNNGIVFNASANPGPRPAHWAKYNQGSNGIIGDSRMVDFPAPPPPEPPLAPAPQEWKPSMTTAEAEAWASQGVESRTFYHGTSAEGKKGIAESGFDLSTEKFGRMWGNGAYVTDSLGVAESYAGAGGPGANVLTMRVKARRVVNVDEANVLARQGTIQDWLADQLPNGSRYLELFKEYELSRIRAGERVYRANKDIELYRISNAPTSDFRDMSVIPESLRNELEAAQKAMDIPKHVNPHAQAVTDWAEEEGVDLLYLKAYEHNPVSVDQAVVFDRERVTVVSDAKLPGE